MELERAGILVLGAGSGLGAATARALAAAGSNVLVTDLDGARAAAVAAEISADSRAVDVTDAGQVEEAIAAVGGERGLRGLVCCAGIAPGARLVGRDGPGDPDHFREVIEVNLIGTIHALRLGAAAMLENEPEADGERGACVLTSSISAFDGQVGQVAYAAAKAGVAGLTLPAARELGPRGVRVLAIAPGMFDTPILGSMPAERQAALEAQVPFPNRFGEPDEFAALVVHALTNRMLNGGVVRLDGGFRLPPR
jgi:NAD(P)-dependent dehydrogenase (short-subunit alcohol dehydrogenase family)